MPELSPPLDKVIARLSSELGQTAAMLAEKSASWGALYDKAMEELEKVREENAELKAKSGDDKQGTSSPST